MSVEMCIIIYTYFAVMKVQPTLLGASYPCYNNRSFYVCELHKKKMINGIDWEACPHPKRVEYFDWSIVCA